MAQGKDPNDQLVKAQIEQLNADLEVTQNKQADDDDGSPDVEGVDDRALHCFLQAGLQEGTLKTELTDKDCTFLVNLINDDNGKTIPYES